MSGERPLYIRCAREEDLTPEDQRRAAVVVAEYSRDTEDCRELLAMLGLLECA